MLQTITSKVRYIIHDSLISSSPEFFEYTTSKVFTLNGIQISSSTLKVYLNGTILNIANYTFDSASNKLIIIIDLTCGDIIEVRYDSYNKYSDTEILGYILSATYQLSINNYATFTYNETGGTLSPTPTEKEEIIIAVIAGTLIGGNIESYKTPEFSIDFNTRTNQSIDDKIKDIIAQADKALGILDYIDLAKNFNIDGV